MKNRNIAITGSSKLADFVTRTFEASPFLGSSWKVKQLRIEDITVNDTNCWIFDENNKNHVSVLINNAHQDFDQVKVLDIADRAWRNDPTKMIINVSSRASQPNISKGHMYASQKAALNHFANNLTYNSDRQYKMTTLNLGLLEHELPSLNYTYVAGYIYQLVTQYPDVEFTEVTMSHRANYREVQSDKESLKLAQKMQWELYPNTKEID